MNGIRREEKVSEGGTGKGLRKRGKEKQLRVKERKKERRK